MYVVTKCSYLVPFLIFELVLNRWPFCTQTHPIHSERTVQPQRNQAQKMFPQTTTVRSKHSNTFHYLFHLKSF